MDVALEIRTNVGKNPGFRLFFYGTTTEATLHLATVHGFRTKGL
jgi:hypothetical protein